MKNYLFALIFALSRQVLFLIPAVLLLPRWFGLNGVWGALPTADFLSAMITGVFLWRELHYLDRQHVAGRQAAGSDEWSVVSE